jgi:alpha-mannosidase
MNNHWHTNYRADQEGPVWFHFAIQPHGAYDPVAATHFGVETTEPLIVAPARGDAPMLARLRIEPLGVVVTAFKPSDDGEALILRMFNPTGNAQAVKLGWNRPVQHVWLSSPSEETGPAAPSDLAVPGLGTVTVRVDP